MLLLLVQLKIANPFLLCGIRAQGKGKNAFTSGFEGAWTDTPTEWSSDYFHNLLDFNWTKEVSTGEGWEVLGRVGQPPGGGPQEKQVTAGEGQQVGMGSGRKGASTGQGWGASTYIGGCGLKAALAFFLRTGGS